MPVSTQTIPRTRKPGSPQLVAVRGVSENGFCIYRPVDGGTDIGKAYVDLCPMLAPAFA